MNLWRQLRPKKEFVIISLFVIGIALLIIHNWDWIYAQLPNVFDELIFLITLFFKPLETGDYSRFYLYLVLLIIAILIIYFLFQSMSYPFSIFWQGYIKKPYNTYQYGDNHFIRFKEKRKYFVRTQFDKMYAIGVSVDIKKEFVITILNYPILLFDFPLFKKKDNSSEDIAKLTDEEIKKLKYYETKDSKDDLGNPNIFVMVKKQILKLLNKCLPNKIHANFKLKNFIFLGIDYDVYSYIYDPRDNNGNTLTIASTRSGKTQTVIKTLIDNYSRIINMKNRPNLIISDPKGELFRDMSALLEARGYSIKCLNFSEEYFENSDCFNPLKFAYDKYKMNFDKIKNELDLEKIHNANFPIIEYYNQLTTNKNIQNITYSFDGACKEIESFVSTFIDFEDAKDPFWPQNANGMACGLIFYILELAILDNNPLKFSINALLTYLSSSPELEVPDKKRSEFQTKILDNLPQDHYTKKKMPPSTSSQQQSTFKTQVISSLSVFGGNAKLVTTCNTIDLNALAQGDELTAIFLVIPDGEALYNSIVTIFVEQSYKILQQTADKNPNGQLKRRCEYILDEFANIPKIPNIDAKLSVCLGRQIRFTMVIQNIGQLKKQYDDNVTETILANSLQKIFIGGADIKDCQDFADSIGKTTKLVPSIDNQPGTAGKIEVHWRPEERNLITAEELYYTTKLGMAYSIVKGVNHPIRGTLLPSFMYLKNYPKQTPEDFFVNKKLPQLEVSRNDLYFNNLLKPEFANYDF